MHQSLTRLLAGMLMLGTILLIWNHVAVAALSIREEPVEIDTAHVPLWQLRINRLGIRRCADCPVSWLRLGDSTRFEVADTGPVDRATFVDQARRPAGRSGMITLFLDPGTEFVLRMRLSPSRSR